MRMAVGALLLLISFSVPSQARAQLPHTPVLTLDVSREATAAARKLARANGWNVVVVVVDQGGHPILLERMDGTQTASVEIALAKARSAAAFRRPTRVLGQWVSGNVALLNLPGLVPIEGGLPLVVEGQVVGAVGVSGATAQQDGQAAQAAAEAVQILAESG